CSWRSVRAAHANGSRIDVSQVLPKPFVSWSRNFRRCTRSEPGCRSATSASIVTTFSVSMRTTSIRCDDEIEGEPGAGGSIVQQETGFVAGGRRSGGKGGGG